MRYEWEIVDIKPGRKFWGHNRAVATLSMIGFDSTVAKPDRYYVCSLADGMMYAKDLTLQGVVDWLNGSHSRPDAVEHPDIQLGNKPGSSRSVQKAEEHALILKVQSPQNDVNAMWLVYGPSHTHSMLKMRGQIPVVVQDAVHRGRGKAYFHATVNGKEIAFGA